MTVFAEVVFPVPVDRSFHYAIPEALAVRVRPGCRVLAPFGKRMMTGFVVGVVEGPGEGAAYEVRPLEDVLDAEPSFSAGFLSFARRLGERFFAPWGEILQAALPPTLVPKERTTVRLTPAGREALAAGALAGREKQVVEALAGGPATPGALGRRLGIKDPAPALKRSAARGMVEVRTAVPRRRVRRTVPAVREPDQLDLLFAREPPPALAAVEARAASGGYGTIYVFGPAASREAAYGRLIRASAARGRRVLFLAPEVALAEAIRERAAGWPGIEAAILHGRLPVREREEEWGRVLEGRANLVIGPRSALLAPLRDLGLVIIDEEHDPSYAQQEGQLYDARRGACLRAEAEGAAVVLGSSTPSVEAYHEAREAGSLVDLGGPASRSRAVLIDDRGEKGALSRVVLDRIGERLGRGESVILFVNRRGYAPGVYCPRCGYSPRCPRCDIAVSYHKRTDQWVCHYCDAARPASAACPECGARLVRRRARGIEAVEEELGRRFPKTPVTRFDADGVPREKDRERVIADLRRGRVPILLATSLLLHRTDVPPAALVGIIAPEALLGLADYRASQWAYQSVSRMRGFAADDPGAEVVIQTSDPGHVVLRAAAEGDYGAFFRSEIESRRVLGYPPFTGLAEVALEGRDLRALGRRSRAFAAALGEAGEGLEVLGPALAQVAKARGLHRVQVIVKGEDGEALAAALRRALGRVPFRASVRVSW